MSAYLVSTTTIDIMISAAIKADIHARLDAKSNFVKVTDENATTFGQMLLRANAVSLDALYKLDESELADYARAINGYRFTKYIEVSAAGAYGCAANFDYQACEAATYYGSIAHVFALEIKSAMARKLVGSEYPWGVENAAEALKYARGPVTSLASRRAELAARDGRTVAAISVPAPAASMAPAAAIAASIPAAAPKAATKAARTTHTVTKAAPLVSRDFQAVRDRVRARFEQRNA